MVGSDWDSLTTDKQRTLLEQFDSNALARKYGKPKDFFDDAKAFFSDLPKQTKQPIRKPHSPPKDLVVSARRDLSFYEANYELFDNAIDEWRKRGAKKDLRISVAYGLETLTGKYTDNAGGMKEADVFRVFIPGESTNKDFSQKVIGSFGMGAKKGIFRLSDGAKIISCPDGKVSFTSEVPEKWETEESWETLDGRAAAITEGTTVIYFFKLINPPSLSEVDELRRRAGVVYAPLLAGDLGFGAGTPKKVVRISINNTPVKPPADIKWGAPRGAEPKVYSFSHTFQNFLETGHDVQLTFHFKCGITLRLPGQAEDAEPDFGIDVYGNGRLIQKFLKEPFGFGTTGLKKTDQATRFVRGQLFIDGHSFAIPWDTHKREYLADHIVGQWLRERLRPIIKSYKSVANDFTGDTESRKAVLAISAPKADFKPQIIAIRSGDAVSKERLPQWEDKPKRSTKSTKQVKSSGGSVLIDEEDESDAELADIESDEQAVTIVLSSAEYDNLAAPFDVGSSDDLGIAVRDCLLSGVAFSLTSAKLSKALKAFKCDGEVGDLSEKIKEQLLKKLAT